MRYLAMKKIIPVIWKQCSYYYETMLGRILGVYSQLNGFLFSMTPNRWFSKLPLSSLQSPACQIHHNDKDHCLTSVYYENKIYLLDSLGTNRDEDRIISAVLKIQLSQIYGKNIETIQIHLPSVMKQDNNIDCGLFAIAFITSYCIRQQLCNLYLIQNVYVLT